MNLKLGNHYFYNSSGYCAGEEYDFVTEVILSDIVYTKEGKEYWVTDKEGNEWEVKLDDLSEVN